MKKISRILKLYWPIILIVGLALFLRLFKISSYMTFLGDEGRDALVWLRMSGGKLTLIGPTTSIGNMYLGPLYYYLMFPFYLLLGTVGPSIGVALFAGATTFFLYFFGSKWFSQRVGLIAAFLYAISPVAIILSRASWNPNVMPFFSLLTMWGIWEFWQKENFLWLTICGILTSFAVQSHYLGLLLIPVIALFWLITLLRLKKNKDKRLKYFFLHSVLCVFIFLLLTVAPLVWFDLRHNFINYKSFYKFFSERQTTVNLKPYKAIPQVWPLWKNLITRLVLGKNEIAGFLFSIIFLLGMAIVNLSAFLKNKGNKQSFSGYLISGFLLIGLLGMGLYKQHIYDHYFGFLFPAVFLLTALILDKVMSVPKIGKIIFWTVVLVLSYFSLKENPLKYSPNFQMQRTSEVDEKILKESGGKPLNLGMIAKQNYDTGYRYFLEKWGKKAKEIDPQLVKETVTEQLFVVCEDKDCQPLGHPQTEIANFGWAKIESLWEFPWGTKLYKLVRY